MKKKLLLLPFAALIMTACDGTPIDEVINLPTITAADLAINASNLEFSTSTFEAQSAQTWRKDYTISVSADDVFYLKVTESNDEEESTPPDSTNETWLQHQADITTLTEFDGAMVTRENYDDVDKEQYMSMLEDEIDQLFGTAQDVFGPLYEMAQDYVNGDPNMRHAVTQLGTNVVVTGLNQYLFTTYSVDTDTGISQAVNLTFELDGENLINFQLDETNTLDGELLSRNEAVYDAAFSARTPFVGTIPEPEIDDGKTPIIGSDLPVLTADINIDNLRLLAALIDDASVGGNNATLEIYSDQIAYAQSHDFDLGGVETAGHQTWYQYREAATITTIDDGTIVNEETEPDETGTYFQQSLLTQASNLAVPVFNAFLPLYEEMRAYGSPDFMADTSATLFVYDDNANHYVFESATSGAGQNANLVSEFEIVAGRLNSLELTRSEIVDDVEVTVLRLSFALSYGNRNIFDGVIPEPTIIDPRIPISGSDLPSYSKEVAVDGLQSMELNVLMTQTGGIMNTQDETLSFYQNNIVHRQSLVHIVQGPNEGDTAATDSEQWLVSSDGETSSTNSYDYGQGPAVNLETFDDPDMVVYNQRRADLANTLYGKLLNVIDECYTTLMTLEGTSFTLGLITYDQIQLYKLENDYIFELTGTENDGIEVALNMTLRIEKNVVASGDIAMNYSEEDTIVSSTNVQWNMIYDTLPVFDGAIPDPDPIAITAADLPEFDLTIPDNLASYEIIIDTFQQSDETVDVDQTGKINFQQYNNDVVSYSILASEGGLSATQDSISYWRDGNTAAVTLRDGAIIQSEVLEDLDKSGFEENALEFANEGYQQALDQGFETPFRMAEVYGTPDFDALATADTVELTGSFYDLSRNHYLFNLFERAERDEQWTETTMTFEFAISDGKVQSFSFEVSAVGIASDGSYVNIHTLVSFSCIIGGILPEYTAELPVIAAA